MPVRGSLNMAQDLHLPWIRVATDCMLVTREQCRGAFEKVWSYYPRNKDEYSGGFGGHVRVDRLIRKCTIWRVLCYHFRQEGMSGSLIRLRAFVCPNFWYNKKVGCFSKRKRKTALPSMFSFGPFLLPMPTLLFFLHEQLSIYSLHIYMIRCFTYCQADYIKIK